MRVAYICADFGIPVRGSKGASVHVREMVAALVRQGHDVRIFASSAGDGNELPAEMQIVSMDGLPRLLTRATPDAVRRRLPRLDKELREITYNLNLYRHLHQTFREWRPDVALERYSLFTLAGVAASRQYGIPHLLEVNAPLQLERARTIGLTLRPAARVFDRRLFRHTDHAFVVSDVLRGYILENGGSDERISVLPNGVDTIRFGTRTDAAALRMRHGLEPDAFVIGFAGSLKAWHGTDVLIRAFAAVYQLEPRARLIVVGDGPQYEEVRSLAEHLGVDAATVFTGAVPHRSMPELLAVMDVGVAPYLQVPNFYFSPLKLYEYMAAGLPVVASRVGSIESLVRSEDTGLLCPPGDVTCLTDTLLRLLRDSSLQRRLGPNARAEAESHSWDHNARIVIDRALELPQRNGLPRETPVADRRRSAA